jgi:hypothetical protein
VRVADYRGLSQEEREFFEWLGLKAEDVKPPAPEGFINFKRELTDADLETVKVPRFLYEIMVDLSRKNAQTLRTLLTYALMDRRAVPVHSIYAALTGVSKHDAIRELKEWADGENR